MRSQGQVTDKQRRISMFYQLYNLEDFAIIIIIFCLHCLIAAGNKRTKYEMYTYGNVVRKTNAYSWLSYH